MGVGVRVRVRRSRAYLHAESCCSSGSCDAHAPCAPPLPSGIGGASCWLISSDLAHGSSTWLGVGLG